MTKPFNLLVHDTPSRLHDRELLLPVGLNLPALFVAVKHLKGTSVLNKRVVWRVEEIKIKSWTWKLCFEKPRWFCIDFEMASTSDDWQIRMPNASSNVTAGPTSIVRSSGPLFFPRATWVCRIPRAKHLTGRSVVGQVSGDYIQLIVSNKARFLNSLLNQRGFLK